MEKNPILTLVSHSDNLSLAILYYSKAKRIMIKSTNIQDDLMGAILKLRTKAEARRFFRDLLTADELDEFGNRWLAARLLAKGVSYTKIEDRTRLSSRTIARVSKWLNNGMNGYKLMISRVSHGHAHTQTVGNGARLIRH